MKWLKARYLLGLVIVLTAAKALAQGANFGQLILAQGFDSTKSVLTGQTGGAYSLSALANTDKRGTPCIGFATPNPDHVIILNDKFAHLKLEVISKNQDLSLLVRGPNKNKILCGFANNNQPTTMVEANNWNPGTYEIWVGSIEQGKRLNYRIKIEQ